MLDVLDDEVMAVFVIQFIQHILPENPRFLRTFNWQITTPAYLP